MRRNERLVHGSAQHGRKHRFVYYCVIAGACFDVTVLVWRKYATICMDKISSTCICLSQNAIHQYIWMVDLWGHYRLLAINNFRSKTEYSWRKEL
jgi:hypothetical protein